MGLAVVSLGRELRALALSHTASVRRGTAPENSVSSQNSRAYCALTSQQMLGCIKAINPCLKSTSAMCKAVSGLQSTLAHRAAPSGEAEERTLGVWCTPGWGRL